MRRFVLQQKMRYAYCGSNFKNIGPWTVVDLSLFDNKPRTWEILRWTLEEPERNYRTFCRGFQFMGPKVDPRELFSKDPLDEEVVIYVVRCPMPLGARSYVPVACNDRYVELNREKEELMKVTYNYGLKMTLSGSLTPEETKLWKRKEQVTEWLSKMTLQAGRHVSEHAIETKDLTTITRRDRYFRRTYQETSTTYDFIGVVPTYKCFTCMRVGHHHKDACFLFEKQKVSVGLKAGADKFQAWTE